MDHLPCPASAIDKVKASVPYVCLEKYDGGPFMTYPNRRDNIPDLYLVDPFPGQLPYAHQMQLASLPKRDLESFYQTWLFFGLIHELLGDLYAPEDFSYERHDHDGCAREVSSSKLIPALEAWAARIRAGTANPSLTFAHVAQCLCMAHAALSSEQVCSTLDPNIRLSLASLGQSFEYAASRAFNTEDLGQNAKCPSTWCLLIDDDYWKGRFLAHGWCISDVKLVLDTTLSLQTRQFLACLDKKDVERDHQGCDTLQCVAYQNDMGVYQTQHVSKECKCEEIFVDSGVLSSILKTKALPLIRVRQGHTLEELSIDIVASRPTSRYVALSHVWADGLGNPQANALPRCQLSNIAKVIQDLKVAARYRNSQNHRIQDHDKEVGEEENEELLLWCDTLCCPVQTTEAKHLALEYMYQTYRNAAYVLVLDASLRPYEVESLDIDEMSMRICTSPWMRRLWTLQEGALPALTHRLWFQFADKAVNLRRLRINARDKYLSSIGHKGLAGDMLRRLGSFANIFLENSPTHPRADLTKIMAALQHRSVSILLDEPVLIGNLLGLNAAQILNGGDGAVPQRMHRLWRLMPSASHGIPSDILFRVGPRLTEPGFKWAPATLLINNDANIPMQSSENGEDQASLTPSDGLFVRLHGFRLLPGLGVKGLQLSSHESIKQLNRPNVLWMKDDAGSWYQINRRFPVEQDKFLTDKTLAEVILEGNNLWIIYPNPEFPRPPESRKQSSIGLTVEVDPEEIVGNDIRAKKAHAKQHVTIAPMPASTTAEFTFATTCFSHLVSQSPALRKLATMEQGLDEQSSSLSPSSKKGVLDELSFEIHQMLTNDEAKMAVAPDGKTINVWFTEAILKSMLCGHYVCMGERVPKSQPWCVD